MFEEIASNVAANVLCGLGKKALEHSRPGIKMLVRMARRQPKQLVFMPEAAGITVNDAVTRRLVVRLVLIGSAGWTKHRPVSMEPCFTATIIPPGSGGYYFAKQHAFTTAPIPQGMHVYYIGAQDLSKDHLSIDTQLDHGVLFDGQINVEGLGEVPIFPLALLAGRFGEGGGYTNEPLELRALKR